MIAKVWTGFMLLVLAGLLAALAVAFARERGWHPLRELSAFVKRESFFGLLLLGTFVIGLWTYASTKHGDGGDGGTNNVPRGAVVELASRGDAESQGRGTSDAARALWQSGIDRDLLDSAALREMNRSARTLTDDDFERGFVIARVGTNEVFEFWAPDNAVVCDDWRSFGAATDWMYVAVTNWLFLVGTNEVDTLRVHSFGKVIPKILESDGTISTNRWIAPFAATLGIVPEANWSQLENCPSQFWHCVTPSNTLQMTWQNVLLNRDDASPMSFQAEFWPSGRFAFRYDLSRLGVEEVSNIVVGAALGGEAWGANEIPTNVTSLVFYPVSYADTTDPDRDGDGVSTEDELFVYGTDPDDADSDHDLLSDGEEILTYNTDPLNPHSLDPNVCDGVAVNAGGEDLFSYPEGSTNTVLEHLFYSGTTNGTIVLPQSSDGYAVLGVTASGYGSGELIVDGKVVPLIGRPQMRGGNMRGMKAAARGANNWPTLSVRLRKGKRHTLVLQGDNLPTVAFYSYDFALGLAPTQTVPGWMCFPVTVTAPVCIHDFNTRTRRVSVVPGAGSSGLVCTWNGCSDVEITQRSILSADVKALFHPSNERTISYTLSHPLYLFGKTTHSQNVRFCPKPKSQSQDDPEEEPGWFTEGGNELSGEPSWLDPEPEPQTGPDGNEEDPVETCPEHHVPYEVCEHLHREAYTNAVATLPHRSKVLLIRDEPVYEPIDIHVTPGIHNCCPCPEHWTNFVGVAYASDRLEVIGENGLPFSKTEESCTIYVAGRVPSDSYGDATLALNRNGNYELQYDMTVIGVAIEGVGDDQGGGLGMLIPATTNIYEATSLGLRAMVELPNGYVRIELADVSGQFAVWCMNYDTGEYMKLVDSQSSPTREFPISAWRRIAGCNPDNSMPAVQAKITSSSPGSATLRFRYWNPDGGLFMEDKMEQRLTALGFEFKTPAGDPVASPQISAGMGQNEFTYNDQESSLQITLQVEVTPALPNRVVLNGMFSLPFIDGANLSWSSANSDGNVSSAVVEGFDGVEHTMFNAHATYHGYPTHNSGFGRKTVTFTCNGRTISQTFEVFFPKNGTHHPSCSTCSDCPNWFYYWRDGGVCGIPEKCLYDGTTRAYGYSYPALDNWIRLGSIAAGALAGPTNYTSSLPGYGSVTVEGHGKGIQCVAEVLQHEQHHIDIYGWFHGQGDDSDGDGVPTSVEGTLDGISTHPDNPNTYNLDPDTYQRYGDNEIRCRKIEMTLSIPIFPNLDWSNPGCQHKNQFGPAVP